MILSILVCTLPERKEIWQKLFIYLQAICPIEAKNATVEIIYNEWDRTKTTGEKRNELIAAAKGKYIVFLDDDDWVPEYYITEILKAAESEPDVITFNGYMTTDGAQRVDFKLRLGEKYEARGGIYYRFPNHIVPMKRELVKDVKFEHITLGEDYKWAKQINDLGLLKTEEVIDKDMYHYQFISKK
jgi:glycosyltransferase involved in cell wall biosynthesis